MKLEQRHQDVLDELREDGPLTSREIADRLDITVKTTWTYLHYLIEHDFVKTQGGGRGYLYYIEEE